MKPLGCLSAIAEATVKTFAMLFGGIVSVVVIIFLGIFIIALYIGFVAFCAQFGSLATLFGLLSPGIFLYAIGLYSQRQERRKKREEEERGEENS